MIHLHVASAGNEFMAHIASLFAEGLATAGEPCRIVVDGCPLDDRRAGALSVVVAPHEYFPLHFLKTRPTIELAPTLAEVAVLNVEQPGSEWFERAWEFARRARHVFDISPSGVAEFQRRGVTAIHTPLGYAPSLEAPALEPTAARPIDVVFFGHGSPRRSAFFARHAEFFSACNCHVILADVHRPRDAGTAGYHTAGARLGLVASSRIVLCVHSTDRPYFEQHRALLALANGCLLVTETSRHTAPLEEGVHFVSAELDELPSVCQRYLADPDSLQAVAAAGRRLAASRMGIVASAAALRDVLRRQTPLAGDRDDEPRAAIRARLADSQAAVAAGRVPWKITRNAAYDQATPPAITVLVTLFNYERHVTRCLDSVLASTPPRGGVEILVIDDGSSDRGVTVVETLMAAAAMPMALVRKSLNTGLADARNVGLRLARGRQVFILDADNWIYPPCLAVLQAALDTGTADAVYGLIARVDDETGQGVDLMSALAWSPRRLLEAPYIDAMALFDRQAVVKVGGYSTELIEHGWFGWEDYDLWLKLAQAGRTACLVPRLVAGYRDHEASMLRRTNRNSETLARYFATKFAALIGRHPGLETHFGFPAHNQAPSTPEEAEMRRLRAHVVSLERQLADVYASQSWRLTAPLRAARGWFGKKG